MAYLIWPTDSTKITSNFGLREQPTAGASTDHKGIDIGVPTGTNVYAATGGVVVVSGFTGSAGNYIRVRGNDGIETVYMHLNNRLVKYGDTVNAGDIIAQSGNTGNTTGAHLHFGIFQNGVAVDPLTFQYSTKTGEEMAESVKSGQNNLGNIIPIAAISLLILAILRR